MNYNKYLKKHTKFLTNKNIIITGATGGLGKQICYFLAQLNANLIIIGRDKNKLNNLKKELLDINKTINITVYTADYLDLDSVKNLIINLKHHDIDYLINNAGAYCLPKNNTEIGYNNVFQINFIIPFFLTKQLLPLINQKNGKVIMVNSIAHFFSKIDKNNIDLHNRRPIIIYGNSKRYQLFAIKELIKEYKNTQLAIVHPGITYTNITSNYNKFNQAIIKYPMKVIFISPKYAALNIIRGIFEDLNEDQWIGPKYFNIWGKPTIKKLKETEDRLFIYKTANEIYNTLI